MCVCEGAPRARARLPARVEAASAPRPFPGSQRRGFTWGSCYRSEREPRGAFLDFHLFRFCELPTLPRALARPVVSANTSRRGKVSGCGNNPVRVDTRPPRARMTRARRRIFSLRSEDSFVVFVLGGNMIRAAVSRLVAGGLARGDRSEVPTAPVAASCSRDMLIALTFSGLKAKLP